ncbi:bifunctional chorismate mutase/prephenate dehydratase [Olsenella phocaeensis]|uniref:bifunctional chorismate mutase/prephenate dehydratase n=1 Tax=Olsenella phocaeensis TaxID=1852385 RepID=UPI003A8EDA1A
MEDLARLRERIDAIDHQMLALFQERMDCAEGVAAYKRERGLPILDRSRERRVVASAAAEVPPELKSYAEVLMQLLMEASRMRQGERNYDTGPILGRVDAALKDGPGYFPQDAYVACQGVEGAFSQMACDRLFKHADISFFDSFDAVFRAVEEGYCEFGVLPVENSTAGSVNQVYDLMMRHDFKVVRSCRLKIDHNLLAKPGCGLESISDVYSHEQALSQCEGFLSSLHGVRTHVVENTAIASRMVAESERDDVAALASRSCAELYGLDTLARSVQDRDNNYTRFACITRDLRIYPGADRSSLMLVVSHEPGSLYRVLSKLHALDINILKLESRPIPDRDFEFMFYFDVECPVGEPELRRLLLTLGDVCDEVRYLGSYSEVV